MNISFTVTISVPVTIHNELSTTLEFAKSKQKELEQLLKGSVFDPDVQFSEEIVAMNAMNWKG